MNQYHKDLYLLEKKSEELKEECIFIENKYKDRKKKQVL